MTKRTENGTERGSDEIEKYLVDKKKKTLALAASLVYLKSGAWGRWGGRFP